MSENILFGRESIVGTGNNTYTKNLAEQIELGDEDRVCITHINLYLSHYNITAAYNNNKFFYKFFNNVDGALDELIEITIPDGIYPIDTLNEFIQSEMVKRGHYLVETETGNFLYMINFRPNSTYYSVEMRFKSVGPQMNLGSGLEAYTNKYNVPTTWKMPSSGFHCIEFIVPTTNNFGKLIGFSGKTYNIDTTTATMDGYYSVLSDNVPDIMPSSSFIMTCSVVQNNLSNPNNVITSFSPGDKGFGEMISIDNQMIYSKCSPGKYKSITLKLYDQNMNPIQQRDPNVSFILSLVRKNNAKNNL